MISKEFLINRIAITAYACLCIFVMAAPAGLAYTSADVKHCEQLVALKDYKKAIERLSSITKDGDFCATNPEDAARAGMVLCDAYEATGKENVQDYQNARDFVSANLILIWTCLKKEEPDVHKRLEKMSELCHGHPQAFADVMKQMLPSLISQEDHTAEDVERLNIVFTSYDELLAAVPDGRGVPDFAWLSDVADMVLAAKLVPGKQAVICSLVRQLYSGYERCITDTDEKRAMTLIICKDYPAGINLVKSIFIARPNEWYTRAFFAQVCAWLRCIDDKDNTIAVYKAAVAGEVGKDFRLACKFDEGNLLFDMKRYSDAISVYSEAIQIKNGMSEVEARAMLQIALCNNELGNRDLVANQLAEVVRTYPQTLAARDAIKQQYILGLY